jgi:hypothetical protein
MRYSGDIGLGRGLGALEVRAELFQKLDESIDIQDHRVAINLNEYIYGICFNTTDRLRSHLYAISQFADVTPPILIEHRKHVKLHIVLLLINISKADRWPAANLVHTPV